MKNNMEANNSDVKRFYGAPLKKHYAHPPKFGSVKKRKSKNEEHFRETYGFYPRSDREMDEFLKWKSGEKGFYTKK